MLPAVEGVLTDVLPSCGERCIALSHRNSSAVLVAVSYVVAAYGLAAKNNRRLVASAASGGNKERFDGARREGDTHSDELKGPTDSRSK